MLVRKKKLKIIKNNNKKKDKLTETQNEYDRGNNNNK